MGAAEAEEHRLFDGEGVALGVRADNGAVVHLVEGQMEYLTE